MLLLNFRAMEHNSNMGDRRIRIYPDTPERIMALAEQVGLKTKKVVEIENAHIIVLVK